MSLNKAPYPFGIVFSVIAQCPADGFVDEKFFLPRIVSDDFRQQFGIGLFLAQQLVYRAAPGWGRQVDLMAENGGMKCLLRYFIAVKSASFGKKYPSGGFGDRVAKTVFAGRDDVLKGFQAAFPMPVFLEDTLMLPEKNTAQSLSLDGVCVSRLRAFR